MQFKVICDHNTEQFVAAVTLGQDTSCPTKDSQTEGIPKWQVITKLNVLHSAVVIIQHNPHARCCICHILQWVYTFRHERNPGLAFAATHEDISGSLLLRNRRPQSVPSVLSPLRWKNGNGQGTRSLEGHLVCVVLWSFTSRRAKHEKPISLSRFLTLLGEVTYLSSRHLKSGATCLSS